MGRKNKEKAQFSLSADVYDYIQKYANKRSISSSVAAERILLKGIEQLESNNYSRIIEDLLNKISVTKDENPGENEEDNKVEVLEVDYSNFDTLSGGGLYDIEGRNDVGGRKKAINSSLYNHERQYSANLVNTEINLRQGQYQTN